MSQSPYAVFKPWFVRRPDGGCQVLFPLDRLDGLVDEVLAASRGSENNETATRQTGFATGTCPSPKDNGLALAVKLAEDDLTALEDSFEPDITESGHGNHDMKMIQAVRRLRGLLMRIVSGHAPNTHAGYVSGERER